VRFHPEAAEEALEAARGYRDQDPAAAERVASELAAALEAATETPLACAVLVGGARRRLFRAFPFALVFRLSGGDLDVLAVMRLAREPGYWRARSSHG
jgi:plasmid stabilization system protein ParE